MGFHLRYGQRFRVYSLMCQEYEKHFGQFTFDVEVLQLYRRQQVPLQPAYGDLYLKAVEPLRHTVPEPLWSACHEIAMGHDIKLDPTLNWSPDLINGHGNWYIPDLFRWQHLFCWLVGNDVIEFLG